MNKEILENLIEHFDDLAALGDVEGLAHMENMTRAISEAYRLSRKAVRARLDGNVQSALKYERDLEDIINMVEYHMGLRKDGPLTWDKDEFVQAEEKAYSLGTEAKTAGKKRTSNPFSGPLKEAWADGYNEG